MFSLTLNSPGEFMSTLTVQAVLVEMFVCSETPLHHPPLLHKTTAQPTPGEERQVGRQTDSWLIESIYCHQH